MWPIRSNIADLPLAPGKFITPSVATDAIWNSLGQVYSYPHPDVANYPGKWRTAILLKNELSSPGAVLPSLLYDLSTTAGEYRTEVVALSSADGIECILADDQLPAAGAPDGSIFWGILAGPALVKTVAAAAARNNWSVGSNVVGTAAGRAVVANYVLTEAALVNQIKNSVGRAMSACTSDETATLKAVYIGKIA